MPFFTDQMKALIDEVSDSADERFAAVARIKGHAQQMLGNAQTFMKQLSDQHRTMASECKSALASDRRNRSKEVKTFRASTRRQQGEARHQLQEMLQRTTAERLRHINHLRREFHDAHQELANDFREASRLWRQPH